VSLALEGKSVLVTGAAGRLGRATVLAVAEAGANVLAVDVDVDGAARICGLVPGGAGRAEPFAADVSEESQAKAMVDAAVRAFGRLDVIFNNAGLVGLEHGTGLLDVDLNVWDRVMAVNLRGVMLGCRAAIPVMLRQGGGVIINTSSDASLAGDMENNAYAAAKAGVNVLTRYVATQFGKHNIRCNAIAPGVHLAEDSFETFAPARREFYAQIKEHCLLPRLGTPEDIANCVVFLASDAAGYITAQVLQVDGGLIGHVPHLADMRRRRALAPETAS
jgi:NAD(P)-dependent dehydrogenase (short-subunit alcohol dehydrogenase family)